MALNDDIRSFTKKYKKNIEIRTDLNDKLFKICDHDKWLKTLKNRAIKCQKLYRDNDKLLGNMEKKLEGELTEKAAEELYNSVFNVFYDRFEVSDVPIIIALLKKAEEYFLKKNDYNKLVRIYAFLAYSNMEYYSRIRIGEKDRTVEYARAAISYKDHYAELDDPEARLRIFRTYSNLMGAISEKNEAIQKSCMSIYNEMLELWNSETVQRMDGKNREIIDEVEWMKDNMVHICSSSLLDSKEELSEGERKRRVDFITERMAAVSDEKKDSTIYRIADIALKIDASGITPTDAIHTVIMMTDAIRKPDFEKLSPEENCDILDEKYMMMELSVAVLRKMEFTEKIN